MKISGTGSPFLPDMDPGPPTEIPGRNRRGCSLLLRKPRRRNPSRNALDERGTTGGMDSRNGGANAMARTRPLPHAHPAHDLGNEAQGLQEMHRHVAFPAGLGSCSVTLVEKPRGTPGSRTSKTRKREAPGTILVDNPILCKKNGVCFPTGFRPGASGIPKSSFTLDFAGSAGSSPPIRSMPAAGAVARAAHRTRRADRNRVLKGRNSAAGCRRSHGD